MNQNFISGKPGSGILLAVKFLNCPDDVLLRFLGEFRIHGQRKDLAACLFALGEISLAVSQIAKTGLKMKRQGIINAGMNFIRSQKIPEIVPLSGANDVLVKNVPFSGDFRRDDFFPGKTGIFE